ncbi:phage tail spike protein [Xiamenia xianingshaonis]|uniref:Phage tail protein n=1 Tax=Xiamenia xianingshaonis TaxID=2682776 RepID=A0A9E6MS00_9ACTN|nr:phage tail spike protein [Xiamenia xianingshaonis]NHM14439.1 hypothetical protein [Xiamenia xianingshaonis]QTU84912.1 phage tail protein [Xiamenia xianingshaonis]
MAAPELYWFDNFDEPLGMIVPASSLVHAEVVKGDDRIEFDCMAELGKGDRIVWRDAQDGCWREHVVLSTKRSMGGVVHVVAEGAIFELRGDYCENVLVRDAWISEAMGNVLSTTRWAFAGGNAGGLETAWFYHKSVLEAIRIAEEKWGLESYATVTVDGRRVAARTIGFVRTLGANRGARFTYSKNMTSCTKTVLEDDVCTALYGWGSGSIVFDDDGYWTGGYTNRLSFASVNDGVPWVGSESARELYGRWNAGRTEKVHRFGEVVFADCEDANDLYRLTVRELGYRTSPQVTYEVDARHFEGSVPVMLGDTVAVIDTSGEREQRFNARVLKRVRTFGSSVSVSVQLETLKQATRDKSKGALIARAADVVTDAETDGRTEEEITQSAVQAYLAQFDLGEEEF